MSALHVHWLEYSRVYILLVWALHDEGFHRQCHKGLTRADCTKFEIFKSRTSPMDAPLSRQLQ